LFLPQSTQVLQINESINHMCFMRPKVDRALCRT